MTELLNGYVMLAVHDNGCGMSREFIAQALFQPFQTTKRQGLGIGLFQSKIIVERIKAVLRWRANKGREYLSGPLAVLKEDYASQTSYSSMTIRMLARR